VGNLPTHLINPRPEIAAPSRPKRSGLAAQSVGIVIPCHNEEENIDEMFARMNEICGSFGNYSFEFLFVDNGSTDGTVSKLRRIAAADPRVGVIVNARDFGWIRSPFHGIMESSGDCVIVLASDLQDPPELIPKFIAEWEEGADVVLGRKTNSAESGLMWALRSIYYKMASAIADVPLLQHVTGFGLYDRRVVEIMREYRDPFPYLRGLISDIGLPTALIDYEQPSRKRGLTKSNFTRLFDVAMLGMTSHSKVPLRLATYAGLVLSAASLAVAFTFLILKLVFWFSLPTGYAPVVIGVFFLGSVQIFLIGLIGEYLLATLSQSRHRPMVVERERFGRFDNSDGPSLHAQNPS